MVIGISPSEKEKRVDTVLKLYKGDCLELMEDIENKKEQANERD